jgi:metal-responsive CopG/Arc/MetJ family transcriptional regulator
MARLNVTLDQETYEALERHARRARKPRAGIIKEILAEGLARRDAAARRKKLAADYLAGRADAREVLKDLESPQLELMDDDDS